jgi:hypothetical protein
VAVQEVTWVKGGPERTEDCTFICGEYQQLATRFLNIRASYKS